MAVAIIEFTSYKETITGALDQIGARKIIAAQKRILIKPNLINTSPPPVTTPVECIEAVISYVRACTQDSEIIIGEGCGSSSRETGDIFTILGYNDLTEQNRVRLLDLNYAPLKKLENKRCPYFPRMYLPEIAFSNFIISVPVLKAHSLADYTGTLKNMMGFAPPKYYSGRNGSWKKAVFHGDMQQSIIDLVSYRKPDLSIIDATIGLSEYHLGGPVCDPPVNKIVAGFDPYDVDREGAGLLGMDWRTIRHLVEKV